MSEQPEFFEQEFIDGVHASEFDDPIEPVTPVRDNDRNKKRPASNIHPIRNTYKKRAPATVPVIAVTPRGSPRNNASVTPGSEAVCTRNNKNSSETTTTTNNNNNSSETTRRQPEFGSEGGSTRNVPCRQLEFGSEAGSEPGSTRNVAHRQLEFGSEAARAATRGSEQSNTQRSVVRALMRSPDSTANGSIINDADADMPVANPHPVRAILPGDWRLTIHNLKQSNGDKFAKHFRLFSRSPRLGAVVCKPWRLSPLPIIHVLYQCWISLKMRRPCKSSAWKECQLI